MIRRDTGGYWSVAEVIVTHSSAPHTWKESCNRFFGRGLCSFLFPDRESTEEETPIARAVGGSFCYARHLRSVLFCGFVINWALPFCKKGARWQVRWLHLTQSWVRMIWGLCMKPYIQQGIVTDLLVYSLGEIENIESNKTDSGDRLLAILSIRVKKAEPLTWNDIYNALISKCIDESKLAKEVWTKHIFIPESSTESESEQEHEIRSEEIKRVKKGAPKKEKGGDHRARVSKEQERSSEDEGIETVTSRKHVQEVESEDEEDGLLSRKEEKEKVRRKGAHYQYKEVHDKERPKGKNKKEKFMKDESQSEQEEVVREKSKRKKKATHDKEESVKGYGDRDHYSDTEVCEKVRKRSKKHSKKREVCTESESEASSDEDEMENSSFEDDTSHKGSSRRKLTKHKEAKIHPQKEHRKDGKRKDAKSRDIQYSDEEVSTKSAQKWRKSKKVETESEEESSFASSSDEEEIEVHNRTKKSKHAETKSAARTKDTAYYESEEKGKTSGKKRVLLKPKSATAKEASHYPEEYKDKGRKRAVRVDERVGKSTDSSRETYHKNRSKPPRKETEGRDGKREVVSEKIAKKATAPPLEQDLPSSEMAQTNSGDGESDESSEDENESEQQSSDEEEETENDDLSTAEENEEKRSKEKATHPTTEMRKTKSQDDENPRSVKGKKLSKAAGAPSKDDSHGDKEESDAGGSRDQEDQPKKRNRRRHRESPIVRGGSSPSSSQEERKPGSRGKKRNKRGRGHKKKSDRKKKGKGDKDGASGIDDSSPECDMKNQSEVETKELASVFECFFGTLCRVPFNPEEIAAQLQKKALISKAVMKEMIISPESQQAKIISLIDALDEMIKSHPEHLFSCIEVMLKNDVLQEPGREMLSKAGKTNHFLYRALFICTFFFSAKVCPAIAAAKFPSQVSPSDLAVVVSPDVVGMQTVTICVVTVVCLLRSTFILQRVRGRHKKGCPAQPQKALHSLCLHLVEVQAMLHRLRQ